MLQNLKIVGAALLLAAVLLTLTGCDASPNSPDGTSTDAPLAEDGGPAGGSTAPALPDDPTPVGANPETTYQQVETSTGQIMLTARPAEITDGYIPNPMMGWQDTQRPNRRFPETVGYDRFDWRDANPAPGQYDWSEIEALRQQMLPLDGQISFRVRTVRPAPFGEGQMMPTWLVEQGAQIFEDEEGYSTEPVYSGCLFLRAHGDFVDAMRQRYDGDPMVAFIDIGSYGYFGEWDSEQYDDEPNSLDWHARRRIIDMYLGGSGTRPCVMPDGSIVQDSYSYVGFQQTQLVMPFTPWFGDSLIYALSRRSDVGIRHDALGSESHQEDYRDQIAYLVEQTWRREPIVFEFSHVATTDEALISARAFVQEMHASIVHDNLDGNGNDALVEELLEVLGYRLVLSEMTYPAALSPGESFAFSMSWLNRGSAPPYVTFPLVIMITDAAGNTVAQGRFEVDLRTWIPDGPYAVDGAFDLPADLPPGAYDVRIAFVDEDDAPILNLAIEGRDDLGRYLIGPLEITP
ncbi:MAG: DUF4832 domain-containing protein [Anaerolineae bacterium]